MVNKWVGRIMVGGMMAMNAVLFYFMKFNTVLEKTDKDVTFYTGQLQNLLLGHETQLMYPQFRVLIPGISIVISKIFSIQYLHAMQVISLLSMVLLVLYIYSRFRQEQDRWLILAAMVLSVPVVILYTNTYFIEMPFFAILLIIFFQWDDYCRNPKVGNLLWMTVLTVAGVLIKEAFLVHVLVMGFYAVVFHRGAVRKVAIGYGVILLVGFGVYFFNYDYLFGLKKHLILNPMDDTVVTTNFEWIEKTRLIQYFTVVRGGLVHMLINLALSLGWTYMLLLWVVASGRLPWRRLIVYLAFLMVGLMFITLEINTGQKYAFLCFGPSILFLVFHNLPHSIDRKVAIGLAVNYGVNLALIVGYGIAKYLGH